MSLFWSILAICLMLVSGETLAQDAEEFRRLDAEVARLYRAGKFAEAIPVARRTLAIHEKALGPGHSNVRTSIHNLATLYFLLHRYAEAEPLVRRYLAITEKTVGSNHLDVAKSATELGHVLYRQGRFADAEVPFRRALSIREKALGLDHADVGQTVGTVAEALRQQGRYADAESLFTRAAAVTEKAMGSGHADFGLLLNNYGLLRHAQGRQTDADALFQRALSIREKALGSNHADVAQTLNNLAESYREQGRYSDAEPLYVRASSINEKALGANHPDFATSLNNLALLRQLQGRYAEAEPIFKRALAIREKVLGPNHRDVGTSLLNLGAVYRAQERYEDAEALLRRTVSVFEKALGQRHPDFGLALNNLAVFYQEQKRFSDAEQMIKRALVVREAALGATHPDVAETLSNLAYVYNSQGRHDDAEPIYHRAISIYEQARSQVHPTVGFVLSNLVDLYLEQGRYADAEPLQRRALDIHERSLAPEHLYLASSLNNMGALRFAQGDWKQAADFWRRSAGIVMHRAKRGLGDLNREISGGEAFRARVVFLSLLRATHRFRPDNPADQALAREMFEVAQWAHASEAAASIAQMSARTARGDVRVTELLREREALIGGWQARDKQLIAARSETTSERSLRTEKLLAEQKAIDARLAAMEARLAKDFPDYTAMTSQSPVSVEDVQAQLGRNEALVLFADLKEKKPAEEETFLWVVTKSDVRWVRSNLGTEALEREVTALRCGLDATAWQGQTQARCYELLGSDRSAPSQANGPLPFDHARAHKLYNALFGQVRDLIKDKSLLLVPSGALRQLPFQVLVSEAAGGRDHRSVRWMVVDHALTVLPAASSLIALRRTAKVSSAKKPIIGFGNPLLQGDQNDPVWGADNKRLAELARRNSDCARTVANSTNLPRGMRRNLTPMARGPSGVDGANLRLQPPLPETADELCAVARDLMADVSEVRLGGRATEKEVKALSASGRLADFRIVHFATHGALAGQIPGANEPGLVLSPPVKATEADNGYLSASEISELKLDADWVILSACNTAAGAKAGGESLGGLARAFFHAQARALLVSHWEVNSEAAVKLISSAVAATTDPSVGRSEALRRSMLSLIGKGKPEEVHPSYWAPFVVVGEGRARP